MASEVEICNRALQKLGAARIQSLTDETVNARACNVAYAPLRDAELRLYPWNFAITRASLAADAVPPDWGRSNAFQLPADFLALRAQYPEDNNPNLDWQIEGRKIYTDDSAPLQIRYSYRVTDPNLMDPLFREALAARIAMELCEELTQSNQKIQNLTAAYEKIISNAKLINAIENVSATPPVNTWLALR